MPSFAGTALGIGGETPFIEKGRQQRRKEGFEDLYGQLAVESALQRRRQLGIQEEGVQARLAQLQRLLQKDEEWKTVGQPRQMKDGTYAQMQFQPSTSQTRFVPVPTPEGGEFATPADVATAKAGARAEAYKLLDKQLRDQGVPDDQRQSMLDRFWPPAERMHWINTQEGIVGFGNLPGMPQEPTTFKGWPPGYGSQQPPPSGPLSQIDWGYVDQLAKGNMTLDMLNKVYSGKDEYKRKLIVAEAMQRGFDPNNQLTGTAAQNVVTAQAQIDINQPLIELIDRLGLKNNNSMGYLAWARLKYGAGKGTPGGLADEIANLELTKVTSAANAMKGSSRAWAALSLALQHTPNVWVDSPFQIRKKLETIDQRLQAVIDEQRRFGTKSGLINRRGVGNVDPSNMTGTVELPGKQKVNLGGEQTTTPKR